jgi:hypothetical protein
MIGPIDIVLLVVMAIENPITKKIEMYYEPLNYYKTIVECNKEQARLTKKNQLGVRYVCLPVDRD